VRIALLIRSLRTGGAERQLVTLARGLARLGHDVEVLSFYPGDAFEDELRGSGVGVNVLEKRGRWDLPGFVSRLARRLRALRPDVLHGYLGVPNLLCAALRPLLPHTRIVWGVRASELQMHLYDDRWVGLEYRLEALLSSLPDLVIVNSHAGLEHAAKRGFPRSRMVVVPNGFDTARFRPDPEARARVRREWAVADDEKLVGLVARLDPIKDHPTFLRAAALLRARRKDVRFVCVGDGTSGYRAELERLARQLGLDERALRWAGARADVPAVDNAFDVACCSSTSEGFPNVVAEAMACGRPCVVTDVGDAARVVGELGLVVPRGAPEPFAHALDRLLDQPPAAESIRRRVVDAFSERRLVADTAAHLERLVDLNAADARAHSARRRIDRA